MAAILTFLICWANLSERHLWFFPTLLSLSTGNLAFYLTHEAWKWYTAFPFALLVTLLQFANILWIAYVAKLLVKAALEDSRAS